MASNQPASLMSIPWELHRQAIKHAVGVNGSNSISSRSAPLRVPALALSSRQLREEYFQYYCCERDIIVDLTGRFERTRTERWLSQQGGITIRQARHIVINLFEEDPQGHINRRMFVIAVDRVAAPMVHMSSTMLATSGKAIRDFIAEAVCTTHLWRFLSSSYPHERLNQLLAIWRHDAICPATIKANVR
jgi:hypothetical protein